MASTLPALSAALRTALPPLDPRPSSRQLTSQPLEQDMKCSGNHEASRACLFKDLYFDTHDRVFTFFGAVAGDDEAERQAHFAHETQFLRGPQTTGNFTLERRSGAPPPRELTCTVRIPVHLRHEYPFGTQSIGHLIRDNFQAMVEIPLNFGMHASRFAWVTWPRESGTNPFHLTHAMEKYSELITNHKPLKWGHLVAQCEAGLLGAGVADEDQPAPRYVHLQQALASSAGMDWTSDGDATRICKYSKFKQMRDLAYSLFDVPHVPAPEKERVVLSIVVKLEGDKRRMIVPKEVTDAVQRRWPEIDVELHAVANEDVDVQMNWLSRTSIFVANIGSPSFRMVYLPDGAQVILVGGLETETTGTDGKLHYMGSPFREAEKCWDHLDYLQVLPYHVTTDEDIVLSEGLRANADLTSKRDWEVVRIRDAHVIVREEPFMQVVEQALVNIDSARSQ